MTVPGDSHHRRNNVRCNPVGYLLRMRVCCHLVSSNDLSSPLKASPGSVFVQCVLYYKLYPGDYAWTKFLVFLLDLTHTILIVVTAWQSVITGFDKPEDMDLIPPFFANRIRKLMKKWYIAVPVVILAFCRLRSTSEIIRLKHYSLFIRPYPAWIFTVGVTLSASVEIIITTTMIIFLGSRKTGFANMNHIINSLILYTLETGSVTSPSVASTGYHVTWLQWLIMRHNLIFLGMHFAIAKRVMSDSLFYRLNTRKRLRVDRMYSSERDQTGGLAAGLPYSGVNKSHVSQRILGPTTTQKSMQLNVNVETTVVSKIDEGFNDFDHDIEDQRDSLTEFEKDEHKLGELRDSSEKEPNVHFP
ncbi:hypothetical protein BKA82DRAFT_4219962 [Pisolithus tinctorius]|nr:hypothetical protein BKA82DRAFT_4219962 [Pisolithus tinctorius]